jgi:hypothetical protein
MGLNVSKRISCSPVGYGLAVVLLLFICGFGAAGGALAQCQLGEDIYGEADGDMFGWSVSLSADGNRVAIGAPQGNGGGHVRVYAWSSTKWLQLGDDIDGEADGDRSGRSVSLSADGNRVAIGAPFNDDNGNSSGHVRVYAWSGSAWLQLGEDIDGERPNGWSGRSVSLSAKGKRLAIGTPEDSSGDGYPGHVQVYEWSGTAWQPFGSDIVGEGAWERFGRSVSLSADGNRLAIGAPYHYEIDTESDDVGKVRIYAWSGTDWLQLGEDVDGEGGGEFLGFSVSLSAGGDRLAIGAPAFEDFPNYGVLGYVRIYEWSGTAWLQLGKTIGGEGEDDTFGYSVSLSADGQWLAIGSPHNASIDVGYVRVYRYSLLAKDWQQLDWEAEGKLPGNRFGNSVSLSAEGERLAIGALAAWDKGSGDTDINSGYVQVYQVSMPVSVEDARSIARLYSAAFDRIPKFEGLSFWIDSFESGISLLEIAKKFNESPEFVDKYGPLTDREYVEQLFRNVLGREGASGGIDFWEGHLNNATPRARVLLEFAESPENISKTALTFANMRCEGGLWIF